MLKQSFQKAIRSLEVGLSGWGGDMHIPQINKNELDRELRNPSPDRIFYIWLAMDAQRSDEDIYEKTNIDKWFLSKLRNIYNNYMYMVRENDLDNYNYYILFKLKQLGFSDRQIAFAIDSFIKLGEYF